MSIDSSLYLDHNATTPVDSIVLEEMLPWYQQEFGNASSRTHAWGWRAASAVDKAEAQVRNLLGKPSGQLIFTSGATEALNLAIKGLAASWRDKKKHLITWATEHKAVLDVCKALGREGFETTVLPVLPNGQPDEAAYQAAFRPDTLLVCGMLANNETGAIFPIYQLAEIAHQHQAFFCCDATQAGGKIDLQNTVSNVDLVALSAHKFYGPKGIGALYVAKKPRLKLQPLLHGGGHQQGLRSGTLPVALIVGLGAAAELAAQLLPQHAAEMELVRNLFEEELKTQLEAVTMHAKGSNRLPNTSNLAFEGVPAALLLKKLRPWALATGSACSSGEAAPSHVLLALGCSATQAAESIRFSFGRGHTTEHLPELVKSIVQAVTEIRAESPQWQWRNKTN